MGAYLPVAARAFLSGIRAGLLRDLAGVVASLIICRAVF
jgi:hypothetical protein